MGAVRRIAEHWQAGRGTHAAKARLTFRQKDSRTLARGRHRGSQAGRPATGDKDIHAPA